MTFFSILMVHNLHMGHVNDHKQFGPVGLAVLMFFGYRHINTDKHSIYLYVYTHRSVFVMLKNFLLQRKKISNLFMILKSWKFEE